MVCFLCECERDGADCDVFDESGHVACAGCLAEWAEFCEHGERPEPLPHEFGYDEHSAELAAGGML